MSDWRNWKVGDLVECISTKNQWTKRDGIEIGDVLPVTDIAYNDSQFNVMVRKYWLMPSELKWHSRPSA